MSKGKGGGAWKMMMDRDGPQRLGERDWPSAKEGVLKGKNILMTGVFETITRVDLYNLITDCGGHIMSGMAKSLNFLLVGRDAGPSKLKKAEETGLRVMNEDEFFEYITKKVDGTAEESDEEEKGKTKKKSSPKKGSKGKRKDDSDKKVEVIAKKKKKEETADEENGDGDTKYYDLEGTF